MIFTNCLNEEGSPMERSVNRDTYQYLYGMERKALKAHSFSLKHRQTSPTSLEALIIFITS